MPLGMPTFLSACRLRPQPMALKRHKFEASCRQCALCAASSGQRTGGKPNSSTNVCQAMIPAEQVAAFATWPLRGLYGSALTLGTRTPNVAPQYRSEEHTSELQSLMRISYSVFCVKKKKQ